MPYEPKYIKTKQVAEMLGISKASVQQKLCGTRELKVYRRQNSNSLWYERREVERLAGRVVQIN